MVRLKSAIELKYEVADYDLIEAINDPANGFTLSRDCPEALSTHGDS